MSHTLSRFLGAAALAASLATAGPASSAQQRPVESRTDAPPSYRMVAPASEAGPQAITALPPRRIFSEVVWRDHKLLLRGDVEAYSRRTVMIQRRGCDSCKWRRFDAVSTGRHGWFRSVIRVPQSGSTFWRAKVRASNGYARSFSATWETRY